MVFMKNFGMTWVGLLRVAALIFAMLLVPAGASAHGTGDRLVLVNDCTEVGPDAVSAVKFDCLSRTTGHRLHCHLASVPPMEAGPTQSLDDDPLVTVAPEMPTLATQNLGKHTASAFHIPIAAPPRFILFGNFRS